MNKIVAHEIIEEKMMALILYMASINIYRKKMRVIVTFEIDFTNFVTIILKCRLYILVGDKASKMQLNYHLYNRCRP